MSADDFVFFVSLGFGCEATLLTVIWIVEALISRK